MRLAVLAYYGISPFMLSTALAVFAEPFLAVRHEVTVYADARRFAAGGGLTIEAASPVAAASEADVVILPGWRSADEPISDSILAALKAANARGAIVVGLCLGTFGLAQAGLLSGRRATTHWARADSLAERYPDIIVDGGALFVDEGRILTSAGIAAGLDCCLHLLARLSGVAEANRVARHLVVAPQRGGGQPQLIDRPAAGFSADRRVADLLEGLRAAPCAASSLDMLARQAGMSRRSLTRHIRARTGGSLGDWLRRLRLAHAQELMINGMRGLDGIAARSGFPDAQAMRKGFRAEFGLTPRQWLALQRAV